MKSDKFILICMIVNIIGLTFLMAAITENKKKNTPPEPTPIETSGEKKCTLDISTNIDNINYMTINYKDNVVVNYSIKYYLNNKNNEENENFTNYKKEYTKLIDKYKVVQNAEIKDYSEEGNTFYVTIFHELIPNDNNDELFYYNENIDTAISDVENLGYICE